MKVSEHAILVSERVTCAVADEFGQVLGGALPALFPGRPATKVVHDQPGAE